MCPLSRTRLVFDSTFINDNETSLASENKSGNQTILEIRVRNLIRKRITQRYISSRFSKQYRAIKQNKSVHPFYKISLLPQQQLKISYSKTMKKEI